MKRRSPVLPGRSPGVSEVAGARATPLVGLGGEMDGTRLIRELQSREKLRRIPVLVVTGRGPRDLPTFAGLAISGLLVKPVAPDTFVSRVEHILRKGGVDLPVRAARLQ